MVGLKKTDVLFAHIALHVAPGLSASARRVGAAIIEHFNKKTGQCDPSLERLATLLGIDRASVVRATTELCSPDGLFERVTHGGRSNRTAYLPRWDRFNDIVDDWDLRMKDGSAPANGAKVRLRKAQKCAVDRRRNAPQTYISNLQKEPKAPSRDKNAAAQEGSSEVPKAVAPSKPSGMSGLRNSGVQPQHQRYLMHALPGGKAGSAIDAAIARMTRDLRATNRDLAYQVDCEATPEMLEEAAAADTARRGDGIPTLIARMTAARLATG